MSPDTLAGFQGQPVRVRTEARRCYRLSVNAIARASHLLATLCIRPATTTLEEEHHTRTR